MNEQVMDSKNYGADVFNDWCAGCGDFGILNALKKALAALRLPLHQVAVFGGIGCSGKTPYYLNTNGVHTLHGRVLPFASGAKLANPALTVIAIGGDGDGLGIGAGHFANTGRRNLDITYILFNNGVYGLTKGQASPTLRLGEQTRSMARESILTHLNPVMLALTSGFTWIGRGYAYETGPLQSLIQEAIEHQGSSFLEVLQPCPTYNDLHDRQWYATGGLEGGSRFYYLQDEDYDPCIPAGADRQEKEQKIGQCVFKAQEWDQRIPLGVFYRDMNREEMSENIVRQHASYRESPPAKQPVLDEKNRVAIDWQRLLQEFVASG